MNPTNDPASKMNLTPSPTNPTSSPSESFGAFFTEYTVYGYAVTTDQIQAMRDGMKKPFRSRDIADIAQLAGVPQRVGNNHYVHSRVADRLIQKMRRAGHLSLIGHNMFALTKKGASL
jgi:hypothetical protein